MTGLNTYIVNIEPGEALDAICHKIYGNLDCWIDVCAANPDIANHGDIVPTGYVVKLPVMKKEKEREKIKLWE